MPRTLTLNTLRRAVSELCGRDEDLARIVAEFGAPPLWEREPGFPTLVRIILEQQVSLASARVAYERLLALNPTLTPHNFLRHDDVALKHAGFSRQKIAYAKNLAHSIITGEFDLHALEAMPDEAVRAEMLKLKGVGMWTADIYLLMALRRADTFPASDLALMIAAQRVKSLPSRPSPTELEALAESWRPWRAVAARILWHHYLSAPASRRATVTA